MERNIVAAIEGADEGFKQLFEDVNGRYILFGALHLEGRRSDRDRALAAICTLQCELNGAR